MTRKAANVSLDRRLFPPVLNRPWCEVSSGGRGSRTLVQPTLHPIQQVLGYHVRTRYVPVKVIHRFQHATTTIASRRSFIADGGVDHH